jgi:hypothetical protein
MRGLPPPVWITPSLAPYTCGRPEATVRDWMRRGMLPTACDLATRKLVVNALDVMVLAERSPNRHAARRRAARALDRIT